MRKIFISVFMLLSGFILISCLSPENQTIRFNGAGPDKSGESEGLYNPGRGFRLETAVDLLSDKENPVKELRKLTAKYASDSVSLVQSYFYLTDLVDKELTEEHFSVMQTYFDEMEKLGQKTVLRFAYEREFAGRAPIGPTLEQTLAHLDQLKPFLEKNKHLILVVQAGIIGAWGEWHSSVHGLENSDEAKKAILTKLLAVVPEEKDVQVRVPEYKNLLKDKPELYNRLSFHDDFIVIKADRWDGDMHEGTAHFNQMVAESPYVVVDGELPWGFWSVGADPDSPSAGWVIDGHEVARRLFLQHYTSLSVIHNYKEQHPNRRFSEDDAPEYSMIVWKKTPLSKEFLEKNKMPVSPDYFKDKHGNEVERNVFEYIRDHMGYRIELQEMTISGNPEAGKQLSIVLELINRGFATVFDEHQVYFVLTDETGAVTEFPVDANVIDWQPHLPGDANFTSLKHKVKTTIRLPELLKPGEYKLGLWMPDTSGELKYNHRYAIRCANGNTVWKVTPDNKYGVNFLTDIVIK